MKYTFNLKKLYLPWAFQRVNQVYHSILVTEVLFPMFNYAGFCGSLFFSLKKNPGNFIVFSLSHTTKFSHPLSGLKTRVTIQLESLCSLLWFNMD